MAEPDFDFQPTTLDPTEAGEADFDFASPAGGSFLPADRLTDSRNLAIALRGNEQRRKIVRDRMSDKLAAINLKNAELSSTRFHSKVAREEEERKQADSFMERTGNMSLGDVLSSVTPAEANNPFIQAHINNRNAIQKARPGVRDLEFDNSEEGFASAAKLRDAQRQLALAQTESALQKLATQDITDPRVAMNELFRLGFHGDPDNPLGAALNEQVGDLAQKFADPEAAPALRSSMRGLAEVHDVVRQAEGFTGDEDLAEEMQTIVNSMTGELLESGGMSAQTGARLFRLRQKAEGAVAEKNRSKAALDEMLTRTRITAAALNARPDGESIRDQINNIKDLGNLLVNYEAIGLQLGGPEHKKLKEMFAGLVSKSEDSNATIGSIMPDLDKITQELEARGATGVAPAQPQGRAALDASTVDTQIFGTPQQE